MRPELLRGAGSPPARQPGTPPPLPWQRGEGLPPRPQPHKDNALAWVLGAGAVALVLVIAAGAWVYSTRVRHRPPAAPRELGWLPPPEEPRLKPFHEPVLDDAVDRARREVQSGSGRSVDELIAALGRGDWQDRQVAMAALILRGDSRAFEPVFRAMAARGDQQTAMFLERGIYPGVNAPARWLEGGGERSVELMEAPPDPPGKSARKGDTCLLAAAALGVGAYDQTERAARSSRRMGEAAREQWCGQPDGQVARFLTKQVVVGDSAREKVLALRVLGIMGPQAPPETLGPLVEAIGSPSQDVSLAAIAAAGDCRPPEPAAVEALYTALAGVPLNRGSLHLAKARLIIRSLAALKASARGHVRDLGQWLAALRNDPDTDRRIAAMLARLGDEAGEDALAVLAQQASTRSGMPSAVMEWAAAQVRKPSFQVPPAAWPQVIALAANSGSDYRSLGLELLTGSKEQKEKVFREFTRMLKEASGSGRNLGEFGGRPIDFRGVCAVMAALDEDRALLPIVEFLLDRQGDVDWNFSPRPNRPQTGGELGAKVGVLVHALRTSQAIERDIDFLERPSGIPTAGRVSGSGKPASDSVPSWTWPVDPKVLQVLQQALQGDPNKKALAARMLGLLGPAAAPARADLIAALRSGHDAVQPFVSAAAWALGRLGPGDPQTRAALLEALAQTPVSGTAYRKQDAVILIALGRTGLPDNADLAAIRDCADDTVTSLSSPAYHLLLTAGPEAIEKALAAPRRLAVAKTTGSSRRTSSAKRGWTLEHLRTALGQMQQARDEASVTALLAHHDAGMRAWACGELARLAPSSPQTAPAIRKLLEDPSPLVVRAATRALAAPPAPASAPAPPTPGKSGT